jgi:SAM-dependent methyltransferase
VSNNWTESEVRKFIDQTEFRGYQRVELPYGLVVEGKDRSSTADQIFTIPLNGKRVLDIGCDYGYFTHEVVKRGAASAMGVEYDPAKASITQKIAEIKGGPVEIRNMKVEDLEVPEPFDVVLCLNVIHHIADPFGFMRKIASLTRETAIIEFPLPSDKRFSQGSGISKWFRRSYNKLPFIGVGPAPYTAAFYFTPRAFELTFVTHMQLFSKVRMEQSKSFPNRYIAFCSK